jgi:predicted RNase H-like nuclease (RuvC/YqgF family)
MMTHSDIGEAIAQCEGYPYPQSYPTRKTVEVLGVEVAEALFDYMAEARVDAAAAETKIEELERENDKLSDEVSQLEDERDRMQDERDEARELLRAAEAQLMA